MAHLNGGKGEGTGLYSGEVHGGIAEAGGGHRVPDAPAERFGDGAHEVLGGEFDPCDVIVMADAQVGEAHPTQVGLHLLDLAQLVRGDGLMVRYCLLYTSDAADEEDSVDLGGRRIIKK